MRDRPEENEYRKSLETYQSLQASYAALHAQDSVPEEELLSFLFTLRDSWPLMFALEQRQYCREAFRYVWRKIEGYRSDSKRAPLITNPFGLFDEAVCINMLGGKAANGSF